MLNIIKQEKRKQTKPTHKTFIDMTYLTENEKRRENDKFLKKKKRKKRRCLITLICP